MKVLEDWGKYLVCNEDRSCPPAAIEAAKNIRDMIGVAVNTKSRDMRQMQSKVIATGAIPNLLKIGEYTGNPVPFAALQILCYRNAPVASAIVDAGGLHLFKKIISESVDDDLKHNVCYCLSAMCAFNMDIHEAVLKLGLPSTLYFVLMQETDDVIFGSPSTSDDDDIGDVVKSVLGITQSIDGGITSSEEEDDDDGKAAPTNKLMGSTGGALNSVSVVSQGGSMDASGTTRRATTARAVAIVKNLCHNEDCHQRLIDAGIPDALVHVISVTRDPFIAVNADIALACLVGDDEERAAELKIDEAIIVQILEILRESLDGRMVFATYFTVWKVVQGLAAVCVPDANKEIILRHGGIEILSQCLAGGGSDRGKQQQYSCKALWNLAFDEKCRVAITTSPGLVDALREVSSETDNERARESAKGCLWTLGLKEDVDALFEAGRFVGADTSEHIMLSYEWANQQQTLLVKNELTKAGYNTWMDVDKMSGSTLEAMANAVERSAVVLMCVSKGYKESQACRTEAEYAFQQKKRIIPLLMDQGYRPSGWLGALLGTKLYFNLSNKRELPSRMPALIKEIGDVAIGGGNEKFKNAVGAEYMSVDRADNWEPAEVEDWLVRIRLGHHVGAFKKHDIDGISLSGLWRMANRDLGLYDQLVQSELQITTFGERLRLVEELGRLFE
jgi:hypothetical protein